MNNRTKQLSTVISVFLIFMVSFSSLSSNGISKIEQDDLLPKSQAAATFDFTFPEIGGHADYSGKSNGDYLKLYVMVASPSGSMPDLVYAMMNNEKYELSPMFIDPGRNTLSLLPNDIKSGIYFGTVLGNLPDNNYTCQFFVELGTNVKSTNSTFNANVSIPLPDNVFDPISYSTGRTKLYTNTYRFTFTHLNPCVDVQSVAVTINGTSEEMNWDKYEEEFFFIKDFGLDTNSTYLYNMTMVIGGISNTTRNRTFTILPKPYEFQNMWGMVTDYGCEADTKYVYFECSNWEDQEPEDIILQVNNVNTTLKWKIEPIYKTYADGTCYKEIIDWRKIQSLDFEDYPITFQNGMDYNVSMWVGNETGYQECKIWVNRTYYRIEPNFTISILNQTLFMDSEFDFYLNGTFKVQSTYENFTWISPSIGKIEGPAGNSNFFWLWYQGGANLTSGEIYGKEGYLFTNEEGMWGNFQYFIEITYGFLLNGTRGTGTWRSPVYTINLQEYNTTEGKYGVEAEQWFIYDSTVTYEYDRQTDCKRSTESSWRYMYEIVDIGRNLGSDFVDYKYHSWVPCAKQWSNTQMISSCKPLDRPGISRNYIDPMNSDTYLNFLIPEDKLDFSFDELINLTAEGYFSKKGNTISGSWEEGVWEAEYEIVFDRKGVLQSMIFTETINHMTSTYTVQLFSEGKGDLPNDDGTWKENGRTTVWTIVLVGGIAGVIIFLRKKGFITSSSP
ncbi:hypothetical protein NEF87_000929 [Candidatus Lokiarchaeum ossiferum]|uniref:SbsA Ig-like domain-containing protein n=1 Tax=Candidatus Lokiarchaeum ossiferum TaxID=2951803 RepID=A0ABY6HPZ9_9ARCH|nr:hypothetical protein NEF87_000929 [Candidatus Lokiarchaeum sp. B-35]